MLVDPRIGPGQSKSVAREGPLSFRGSEAEASLQMSPSTVRGLTWLSRDETFPCSQIVCRLQGSAIKGYVLYGND